MSEENVMPQSFIDRVNVLAHAKGNDEPLFSELQDTYCGLMADSPLGVATHAEYETVENMISGLNLPFDEVRKWEDAIGMLVGATESAAFACGTIAGGVAPLLFSNGKAAKRPALG